MADRADGLSCFVFDEFFVFAYHGLSARGNAMTASEGGSKRNRQVPDARTRVTDQCSTKTEERIRGEARDVFSGLSRSLVMALVPLYQTHGPLKQNPPGWKRMLEAKTSEALIDALVEEFFDSSSAARRRRAVLSHLLSTAELASLDEPVMPAATVQSSHGRANRLTSEVGELTSEEAAKLLHVSRTHLNTLVDEGALGDVRITQGGHRRIPRAAVLAYKEKSTLAQRRGLDKMTEASQRMGLYDGELEGLPVRKKGR
jgi:excisionase family DNA binding protein